MAYYIAALNTSNFRFLKSIIFKSTLVFLFIGCSVPRFHSFFSILLRGKEEGENRYSSWEGVSTRRLGCPGVNFVLGFANFAVKNGGGDISVKLPVSQNRQLSNAAITKPDIYFSMISRYSVLTNDLIMGGPTPFHIHCPFHQASVHINDNQYMVHGNLPDIPVSSASSTPGSCWGPVPVPL